MALSPPKLRMTCRCYNAVAMASNKTHDPPAEGGDYGEMIDDGLMQPLAS